MTEKKVAYEREGCEGDTFKIIEETSLFDNNTVLFKIICVNCGKGVENRINPQTMMLVDSIKDKIDSIQMNMRTVLSQFNDLIKSKGELKETEDILKSIDYITSIQETIIS